MQATLVSLPRGTKHQETGTAARTSLIAPTEGWVTMARAVRPEDSKIIKLCRQSICKPGKLNQNGKRPAAAALEQQDKEEQLVSQGKCPGTRPGSHQMRGQERLQGSIAQLEELKWKWRMPK